MAVHFKDIPAKQWVKASIACVLYILFIVWVDSYWWLLLLPIIADIYLTKFIPWTWWKKIKNKTLYTIMSWVDAIVFALIAVYFIHNFFFQNYQIPSSSLEKSMLVGDFLLVSKVDYGARVPMTPLSMPLTQHTLPLFNCPSFLQHPQWEYRRLAGFDTIQALDIVVFNFPAGDTVAAKVPNPDYYTLCRIYGREVVRNHPERFGEILYRPVDRRENYVKRCVGLPGDTLSIQDGHIFINGQAQYEPKGLQMNYYIATDGRKISEKQFENLGISKEDRHLVNQWRDGQAILSYLQYTPVNGQFPPVYYLPLTQEAYHKIQALPQVTNVIKDPDLFTHPVFPVEYSNWTRDNYGPLYIPRKGATLALSLENLPLYERIIHVYEGNDLQVKDSVIYINQKPATSYTFQMDYYWMMGDNRHNSEDSRYWGFVPEDHIVGKPLFVWLSLDKDKSGFGKIRWERFFKSVDALK